MAPFTVDRYASRREVLALCRVLREKATLRSRQPLWQCTRLPNDDIAEMSEKDRVRLPLIYVFLPSTSNHYLAAQQASQVHDATLTVLALIRFKLRHGNWPKALGDLIPAFLEEVPLDRFTGVPLGYCIVRGGPLLYSFGPDRDNDGGTAPASGVEQLVSIWAGPKRMHSAATIDGDWILWPSPHRPVFEESPFPAR